VLLERELIFILAVLTYLLLKFVGIESIPVYCIKFLNSIEFIASYGSICLELKLWTVILADIKLKLSLFLEDFGRYLDPNLCGDCIVVGDNY
jgi:hypothetical protein